MKRIEFERVSPESVGIPSQSILDMIDVLEEVTEIHSFMIMRHNKICAEGWWSPYAPDLHHGLLSQSKTYTATAIGRAYQEGLLRLDERVVNLFPDKLPEMVSENLKKLTIYHLLTMSNGMDSCSETGEDWVRTYLATPVNHEPGSVFFYNSAGTNMLGEIILRKTGMSLDDYLKTHLFPQIGIDGRHIVWDRFPNGDEHAAGGMLATTEDNLRLMSLYLNNGVWDGERLLPEDFVQMATTKQIETFEAMQGGPEAEATDHLQGYGFQMWMGRPDGCYRSDGAGGQYGIVFPKEDMIVTLTECGRADDAGVQRPLDAVYDTVYRALSDDALPENPAICAKLRRRVAHLSLTHPVYQPYSPMIPRIDGARWVVIHGKPFFTMYKSLLGKTITEGFTEFLFRFEAGRIWMECLLDGTWHTFEIATDGRRMRNVMHYTATPYREAYMSGYWENTHTLCIATRWLEGPYEHVLYFDFDGSGVTITFTDKVDMPIPADRVVKAVRA